MRNTKPYTPIWDASDSEQVKRHYEHLRSGGSSGLDFSRVSKDKIISLFNPRVTCQFGGVRKSAYLGVYDVESH